MHYKNGREAKNGDKIVVLAPSAWDAKGEVTGYAVGAGILCDAVAGNDYCNGKIAPMAVGPGANLAECLHLDDVLALLGDLTKAPDTSKK